jgi:hypothetical protein
MNFKDLTDLASNPDFISGIYNYCDRWCERCPLTSRCLLYATEKEDDDQDPSTRDIRNAAFWRKLESIFKETQEMIVEWAKESGIDLNQIDAESAADERCRRRIDFESHELARAAKNYALSANKWFDEQSDQLPLVSDECAIPPDVNDKAEHISEATEVIRWYQFQIAAKIVRGLASQGDEDKDEDEFESEVLNDSDGSVKVALIAMDRSIAAWRMMQIHRPDKSASMVSLLFALEQLRQNTEQIFPNAREFIRPGFDELPDQFIN